MKKVKKYMQVTADFETTTTTPVRVWCWSVCDIKTCKVIKTGLTIKEFVDYVDSCEYNLKMYFHNAKFDKSFIVDYLLKNGYKSYEFNGYTTRNPKKKEFFEHLDDLGSFYTMKIATQNGCIEIFDSLKIAPVSLEKLAKGFQLDVLKGSIDYTKERPEGYEPTEEEWKYVKDDTIILAKVLKILFANGFTKKTLASDSLKDYINMIGKDQFNEWFPKVGLSEDDFFRDSYRGGLCNVNTQYKNKLYKNVHYYYYDVNSMYPSKLYKSLLPYGKPVHYFGNYVQDDTHPLYIQKIRLTGYLKENRVPAILLKQGWRGSNYLHDAVELELTLTCIDLERLYEDFEILNIEYLEGYKFKGRTGMFKKYVEKYYEMKKQADAEGNGVKRMIAKLKLNALSGKFGQNPRTRTKYAVLDENGKVKYILTNETICKDSIKYTPLISFVTAYSRKHLLDVIYTIGYNNWMYSDTDSIISTVPFPADIVGKDLGDWDLEKEIKNIKILGQKAYILDTVDDKRATAMAGCNKKVLQDVEFANFTAGGTIKGGSRKSVRVDGGTKIIVKDFIIKQK